MIERAIGFGEAQAAFMYGLAADHDAAAVARSKAPVWMGSCCREKFFLERGWLRLRSTVRESAATDKEKNKTFSSFLLPIAKRLGSAVSAPTAADRNEISSSRARLSRLVARCEAVTPAAPPAPWTSAQVLQWLVSSASERHFCSKG